ncbi:hypothetical protein [Clostridium sp.]|uniref:hypothetical protein n=1 Tax=Clostridium sp. TaxID=1506 RepID=UPI00284582F1|nr:hypothetical protein [Clostridium sp.]MDR3594232.1 hypothetical protein [Clostridium sp.]
MKEKFTIEEKETIVSYYLNTHESIVGVSKHFGISVSETKRILHEYDIRYGNKITPDNKEIFKEKYNKKVMTHIVHTDDK